LRIGVGRRGRHEFATLRALLRDHSDLVADVLTPSMRLVDRLGKDGQLPIALRPLLLPADTTARSLVLLRAVLFDPLARRAAFRAARSREVALPEVTRDLMRLHALREALAGRIPEIRTIEIDRSQPDRTRFVSVPAQVNTREGAPAAEMTGSVWDNSAVGSSIFVRLRRRRLEFSLGPNGVWEFNAFAAAVAELADGHAASRGSTFDGRRPTGKSLRP